MEPAGRQSSVDDLGDLDDLSSITALNQLTWGAPAGAGAINQRFSIAAGAYKGNSATPTPLWGIALGTWSADSRYWLATLNSDVTFADQFDFSGNLDGAGRYPVVPFDLDGESIYLGAPVHFIIDHLVNTDFVLQEPPKHAFYDNRPQITINGRPQPNPTYGQVVTVSRYDETNVALQTSQGTTFSGKNSDSSDWSIGGSVTANAGGSVAAGFGDVDKVEASVDVTRKVGYDYNQNQDNYNSNYSERTLTQTEQTDHDDKLLGRLQTFDVWRYRVYGVSVTDAQGQPANAFMRWCSPARHCPSTAAASTSTGISLFTRTATSSPTRCLRPARSRPQTSGPTRSRARRRMTRPACCDINADAACADRQRHNAHQADRGTARPRRPNLLRRHEWLALTTTRARPARAAPSATRTLAESVDVKVGVKAKVSVGVFTGKAHASVDAELHNSNSWSGMRTSESETTSDTGITLSRSSGDSTQGYAFYPVFYTAQDGTIKVTHAAGVLESSTGRSFWAGLYGGKSAQPPVALHARLRPDQRAHRLGTQLPLLAQEAARLLPAQLHAQPRQ